MTSINGQIEGEIALLNQKKRQLFIDIGLYGLKNPTIEYNTEQILLLKQQISDLKNRDEMKKEN